MNRRIVGVLVALLTLCLFGIVLYCSGLSKSFSSFYVSDDEWSKIFSNRQENSELNLSSLKFNGYNLAIAGDKAYYSIIDNDKHGYNPIISLSGNLELAVHGEQISTDSINNNRSIEFVVYNRNEYRKLNLVSTTLPILNIDFDNRAGHAPETRENEFFRMTLFDNNQKTLHRITNSEGMAHRRGNASFITDKPNLTLKLTQESVGENTRSNPQPLLGMNESDSWILSGMYWDYEKVRDAFAAIMWQKFNKNSFNIENAFELRYVEVIINGDYSGLYLLGTKPSPDTIASKTANEEHPDIMFKIEDADDIEGFVTDQTSILRNYKQETHVSDKVAQKALHDYYTAMLGSDIDKIDSVTDIQNAVDFHLFVNFTQNWDIPRDDLTGYKNAYLSFKWDGESYKAIFTPWDFDIALGSNTLNKLYYNFTPQDNIILGMDSVAAYRRNGNDLADTMVQKRYSQLRQGALSDVKIDEVIDDLQSDIFDSGAFRRNQERWTESQHGNPDIKLDDFRSHIHNRLAYLDEYYSWLSDDYLTEAYTEIPNYITEYLNTGNLLSPDDPDYLVKQEDIIEEPVEDYYIYDYGTPEPVLW